MANKKIKILFLDTNPIILMDKINKLDIFTLPQLDVYITDAVKYEFLQKKPCFSEEANNFLKNSVSVKNTELGMAFERALLNSAINNSQFDFAPFKDLGERTMLEFLSEPCNDASEYLIITNDYKALMLFHKHNDNITQFNCVEMSTFLRALEEHNFINSSDAIIKEIESIGSFETKKETKHLTVQEKISFNP